MCYEELEIRNAEEQLKKLKECGHTFCRECFTEFLRSMIEDQNKHHLLKCPEVDCNAKPTEEEI